MPNQARSIHKKRKRRYAAPIGGLFLIFAVIGVVAVAVSSIRLTSSFLDNDREKERFADLIRPVVMFDPVPFEDIQNVEMVKILHYSMWATLTSEKRSSYEFADNTEMIVPASDLDVACARLFGSDVELVHQPFGDYETTYVYEEKEGVYIVPITASLLVYNPRVEEITKDGEFLNLQVAYVPPASAWTQGSEVTPDKYMIYVMRREGDNYLIDKVRDVPAAPDAPLEGPLRGTQ